MRKTHFVSPASAPTREITPLNACLFQYCQGGDGFFSARDDIGTVRVLINACLCLFRASTLAHVILLTFDEFSQFNVFHIFPGLDIFTVLQFVDHVVDLLFCGVVAERAHHERNLGQRNLRGRLARFHRVHVLASQESVVEIIFHFSEKIAISSAF